MLNQVLSVWRHARASTCVYIIMCKEIIFTGMGRHMPSSPPPGHVFAVGLAGGTAVRSFSQHIAPNPHTRMHTTMQRHASHTLPLPHRRHAHMLRQPSMASALPLNVSAQARSSASAAGPTSTPTLLPLTTHSRMTSAPASTYTAGKPCPHTATATAQHSVSIVAWCCVCLMGRGGGAVVASVLGGKGEALRRPSMHSDTALRYGLPASLRTCLVPVRVQRSRYSCVALPLE